MGEYHDSAELIPKVHVPPYTTSSDIKETLLPIRDLLLNDDDPFREYRGQTFLQKAKVFIFSTFTCLQWMSTYKRKYIVGDLIGGLTIASLAVPQDLGYAKLAHLPPVNGLYSSFTPPLIYSIFGSSKHVAIGPVAVVSLLMGTLLKDEYNPDKEKDLYYNLAITSTFFAGIFQLGMGIFRLGFIIDFLSHAAIIGFMGGAAITIGLQQLKGATGYKTFTNKTDIVSVCNTIVDNTDQFQWRAFLIFISFLTYLYTLKFLVFKFKKNKVFFFLNALGPLVCVVVATAAVYASRADKDGLKVVGKIKKGLNPWSFKHIILNGDILTKGVKVGLIAGLVALTESVAIARTFAALKGYHIDGNKEMIALGSMNLCGSITSCYVATGSFSRSAVNYSAGTHTTAANIVMALVVLFTLLVITPLFKYLPNAVLSSIIFNAVTSLIDIPSAYQVWKTDKVDFLALLGAFFGVLFVGVEIGLLIAVIISCLKLILIVARPRLAVLGKIPGTSIYRNVTQYPEASTTPGLLVVRVDSPVSYANSNFIRERLIHWSDRYSATEAAQGQDLQYLILELTPVTDLDTTGIHSLEELHKHLRKNNVQLGLSNPSKQVLWKLQQSGFLEVIGQEWLFVSVEEGVKTCGKLVEKI
eukprot:jgi/Mesen1/7593/ME000395S06749